MRRVKPRSPAQGHLRPPHQLEFHGATIASDGGLLAYRELDDLFDLTAIGASALGEDRRGRNIRHHLPGLLRQAVFGRLAGSEHVNDAERLGRDPALRAIVGREDMDRRAASTSQIGRFETESLAREANLAALTPVRRLDRPGACAAAARRHHPRHGRLRGPTHGLQEGSAWNGPSAVPVTTALRLQPVQRPRALPPSARQYAQHERLGSVLEPVITRYRERGLLIYSE